MVSLIRQEQSSALLALPMLRDRNLRAEIGGGASSEVETGCISVILERGGIVIDFIVIDPSLLLLLWMYLVCF